MATEDEKPVTPAPIAKSGDKVSETNSCPKPSAPSPGNPNTTGTSSTKLSKLKDIIVSAASNMASQPLQSFDFGIWGVLTAVSNNARKRPQGINILLTADQHWIGRLVEDVRFRIDSSAVSAKHCMIYRLEGPNEKMESATSILLKDMSTNGTYLNWKKITKNSDPVKVCHGDIISFASPPQNESAFAFVYRELPKSAAVVDNLVAKRKAEELVSENKRLKGLGIGAPEGPISLDDFRSLQRSNTELRKQLEDQVVIIETLRNENRAAVEHHESELKSVKDSVVKCYLDRLKELQEMVDLRQKELFEINRASAEQKHIMEDLNERLNASMQSCTEANAIISSQKLNIAELKEQLHEEQSQRKEEREKAVADLKAAVQRAQSEAQEELKRLSDTALRRERELQESINKLQESERERCLLAETLRSKLEDTRQKLVVSDNKVRQLETQLHDEQLASANHIKRVEELEQETRRLKKELENEKAAREEAWAKVSVLELEINAATRDLDFERRRLKAAREKLMLRETQLRAFYSTTEEIQVLFAKQQEQLKAMQRTLEDEENYANTSFDIDGVIGRTSGQEKEVAVYHRKSFAKAGSTTTVQKDNREQVETSSNEASVTEKHDCDIRSEECQNTQEAEFTSADHDHGAKGGFGSDIDGAGTFMEGDAAGTVRVCETESPANYGEQNIDLDKCAVLAGDTMQCDDDVNVQETEEQDQTTCQEDLRHSQSNNPVDTQMTIEDTEAGGTIRTADLLASEVAGSWACSTAPSVHGENERVIESHTNYGEQNIDSNKCAALVGDTMQFDDDVNVQETEDQGQTTCQEVLRHTQSNNPVDTQKTIEDTEAGGTIRTADLLASEVAGSWACSTAPSGHGENESQRSRHNSEGAGDCSCNPVAESQSTPDAAATIRNSERRALSEMIGIVAPDLRKHFEGSSVDCHQERENSGSLSDSDTESCSNTVNDAGGNAKGGSVSDAETEGSDHVEVDQKQDDAMDEDEDTQEDSLR